MLPLVVAVMGCAQARRREIMGVELRLRNIEVKGNELVSEQDIEAHMNHRETTWFPLPDRHWVHEGLIPIDEERIEALYAARGYHDARVLSIEVERHERRDVADLVIEVDEGLPTVVKSIDFHWPEGPGGGPPDRRATPARIQTQCGLTIGSAFDVEELNASEATMAAALATRGYAYAEVEGGAEVDRVARTAHVVFVVRPGPFVRIGKVDIKGLVTVPEEPVRVELKSELGKPYSPRRLERIEDAVYGLGVFDSVTVTKSEAPRDGYVDLELVVQEGEPQMVQVGAGLGLQPNRWEQFGRFEYEHANLWRTLTHFDIGATAGYAELPNLFRPRQHGPIAKVMPRLRKKGLLEDHLIWTLSPTYELGLQEGYQFHAPSNRVGVSRFFTRFFELGVSHNLRYVDFFAITETLDRSRTLLGPDFRDPYVLSYIEVQPRVHLTDRLIDPRHGVELGLTYDLAGGIFGGQFDYHRLTPELIGYYTPLRNRLQLAVRAQVGFILPFGDEPAVPIDRKYYLGGSSTVRGWGLRRLSPRVTECYASGECSSVPVGGNTAVLGNFEARVRVWKKLWAVGFLDAGDVQEDVRTIRPGQWNYSAGPGLRYDSRLGLLRLDLGVRLNDPLRFADQPRVAVHFALGDAF